jgi:hypothetical protein
VIETRGFEAEGAAATSWNDFVADIAAVDGCGRVVNDHQLADLTAGAPNVASASSRLAFRVSLGWASPIA